MKNPKSLVPVLTSQEKPNSMDSPALAFEYKLLSPLTSARHLVNYLDIGYKS